MIPLHADLVDLLKPWLAEMPSDARLWSGGWARNHDASRFIKNDLKAARAAWLAESESEAQRRMRDSSDFLCYYDHDGRQADFHALRHTSISGVGRTGTTLKVVMPLARHTTPRMTLRYMHTGLHNLTSAIDQLPTFPVGQIDQGQRERLPATGTDDATAAANSNSDVLPNCLPAKHTIPCNLLQPDATTRGPLRFRLRSRSKAQFRRNPLENRVFQLQVCAKKSRVNTLVAMTPDRSC